MKVLDRVHRELVAPRRAAVLARLIADLLPESASVLDLGAGDGFLASLVAKHRPDVEIRGVDVIPRALSYVPVMQYNGVRAPFGDETFDAVLLVDVLHHAFDTKALFAEAVRLSKQRVVIKDHLCESAFDRLLLRFMDRVSNAQYGVPLPYNYLAREEWQELLTAAGSVVSWNESLGLYPWPATVLFDRSMHFVAAVDLAGAGGRG